ncbi:SufD family Fe-S cluster assembly protein [bacterium]|nr:SufD family Fe-S cluster assembly protein [bacterium]
MMQLEDFLENYSNVGMNPYIVLNDNAPLLMETTEKDVQILNIKNKLVEKYLKGFKLQENTFKDYTGYLILLAKGSHSSIQTCFLTSKSGFEQNVRNVIVVEEDANLDIFTGCLSNDHVKSNTHNAITDLFVGKNATLTFNMIHSWGKTSKVFPKTVVHVEEGGTFTSNYVVWDKVEEIRSNPKITLDRGAKAVIQSLICSHSGSKLDIGGKISLLGSGSSGEILSNVVSQGGKYKSMSEIVGKGENSRGHIECDAVLLSKSGSVEVVPVLKAKNSTVQMSHEASIGKISKEEIEYLQSKGLDEKKAQDLIVKGFVNNSVKKMPESVIEKIEEMLSHGSMF